MVRKRLLRPERLRRVPSQFSWVDHRLVRERYLERCDAKACALYLFLVTVADAEGLSYYADASLGRRLHLDPNALERARSDLVAADLIAYEPPLYQVLSLDGVAAPTVRTAASPSINAQRSTDGARHLAEILRGLGARP
ncbi:MAG: hypothetical protein V3U43_00840 [Pseudomonadales bacterium]